MRIAYVTANFPYGGGEAYFESELAELRKQGHDLLVIPRSTSGLPLLVKSAERWRVEPGRLLNPPILAASAGVLLKPRRFLRVLRILLRDPVHILRNLALVPKAVWLANLAAAWSADHIHAHWAGTTSTMAMIAAELSGIPWSFTAHRWDIEEGNLLATKLVHAAFARVISSAGLGRLSQQVREQDRSKIHVVHMGVGLPASPPGNRGLPSCPTIICVGHLNPGKGHECLLQATARLAVGAEGCPTVLIAGDGPLMAALRKKAASLGIAQRVRFLGHLAHEELLSLYAEGRVDLAVLPSSFEGIPVALMEAMSFGIPVIATPVGGVPELCGGGCGIMIPPDDPDALAAAIEQTLADKEKMQHIGDAGRRRVYDDFSVEETVRRLVSLMSNGPLEGSPSAHS